MVKTVTLYTLEQEARKLLGLVESSLKEENADAKKVSKQIEKLEKVIFSISYQHRLLFLNATKAKAKSMRSDKDFRTKLIKAAENEDKSLVRIATAIKKKAGEKERVPSRILELLDPKILALNEGSIKTAKLLVNICENAYQLSLLKFA